MKIFAENKMPAAAFLSLIVLGGLFLFAAPASAQSVTTSSVTCNSVTFSGFVDPNGASTDVRLEYGTTLSYGTIALQQTFTTASSFSQFISGLSQSTTYHARLSATNSFGTSQATISFTTPACTTGGGGGAPTVTTGGGTGVVSVTTNAPTTLFGNQATLNGFVSSGSTGGVTAWFEWGDSQSLGNITPQQSYGATAGTNFSYTVSGLLEGRTYYYRAVASGGSGSVFGAVQQFTPGFGGGVGGNQPYITTYSATGIGDTFAVLNGYSDPAGSNTTRWFEWGTGSGYLGDQTIKQNQGLAAGPFNQSLTGLQPNTIYYFRAVAQSASGYQTYGNVLTFTTGGFSGTIYSSGGGTNIQATTLLATNVGQTSARLNGLVTLNASVAQIPQTNGYFEWGTDATLFTFSSTPSQAIGNAPSSSFFASLFNLKPSTRYYYRAVATNSNGTSKGEIRSFTTGSAAVTAPAPVRTTTIVSGGTARPTQVALSIDRDGVCNLRSSSVEYAITYKNISTKLLKDVAIRIVLPEELDFTDSTRGAYTADDRTVVLTMGTLAPNEAGTIRVRAEVARSAAIGKTTVITAYLVDTDSVSGAQEEVVAYSLNPVCERDLGQGALSFFGGDGFLPDSLIEWLLLILIILALVVLARNFYGKTAATTTV